MSANELTNGLKGRGFSRANGVGSDLGFSP